MGNEKHTYVTQNGKVVREYVTNNGAFVYCLDFFNDAAGRPYAMRQYTDAALTTYGTYYYLLNAQGDVMGLFHQYGSVFASYTYDAWGRVLSATGTLANVNPLRYRGYYYDTETGWYYLQSRYYDPIVKRFLNADIFYSTGQGFLGYNMFAYCNNDPVNMADTEGGYPYNVGMTDGGEGNAQPIPTPITYFSEDATKLSLEDVLYYVNGHALGYITSCTVTSNGTVNYNNILQLGLDAGTAVTTLLGPIAESISATLGYAGIVILGMDLVAHIISNLSPCDTIPAGIYNSYTITISGTYSTTLQYEGHQVTEYVITLTIYEAENGNTYLAGYSMDYNITYWRS